jgi:hypothetical protein
MVKDFAHSKWNTPKHEPVDWKWNAKTPDRISPIVNILYEQDGTFAYILRRLNEWWKALGKNEQWSRNTLSLYLHAMEKEGMIIHKGARQGYSLNKKSPKVAEILGTRRIRRRANLNHLNEGQFIQSWSTSLDSVFLNIVKDYSLLGKAEANGSPKEKIQQIMHADIQDIMDIVAFYGDVMVKRIVNADEMMKEEKILEVLKNLQKERYVAVKEWSLAPNSEEVKE